MHKNTLFLALVAIATALANTAKAEPIDAQRAQQIAARYVASDSAPRLVSKGTRRMAAAAHESQATPYLYIYSRGEGQGFVIVSGDDAMPEALAVVDSGDWDEQALPPHLLEWVEDYASVVAQVQAHKAPSQPRRAPSGTQDIAPLTTTHWHQSAPYNNRAPFIKDTNRHAVTGCVATAAAQVVYYWHKDLPTVSAYDTPTYGYGDAPVTESVPKGTPLKWDLMRDSYSNNEPAEMLSAVADFMFITGASTWLTYGESTSGQISNLVATFNGQYNLQSECRYKSGTGQVAWEKLIIADLEEGRPIVYSGVHKDNGGHAVMLDGYRMSDNLFHFNFGWGGQGDGWFTVDDETGMNYFNDSQGMTFRVHPKRMSLTAEIMPLNDGCMIQRVPNTIRVRVTNNGTVSTSGINLYCLTGTRTPTGSSPVATDKTTLPVGETVELSFSYKPAVATSLYNIFITDADKNVLARLSDISITPSHADLSLLSIDINGATSTKETPGNDLGETTVHTVYNTLAQVTARIHNAASATTCQPSLTCTLDTLCADGSFTKATSASVTTTVVEAGETGVFTFNFKRLVPTRLYRATISTSSINDYTAAPAGADSVVFFRVVDADMALTSTTGDRSSFTGHYNSDMLAQLTADATATELDLTQVEGRITPAATPNANAIILTTAEADIDKDMPNVVQNGICKSLQLQQGHNFAPSEAFTAQHAELTLPGTAGKWSSFVSPFNAHVPRGMVARMIHALSAARISKADSCNFEIAAATPYLYRTISDEAVVLTADNVTINITADNLGTDSIKPAWRNTTGISGQQVIDMDKASFVNAEGATIASLTVYAEYPKAFATTVTAMSTKDAASQTIIDLIAEARLLLQDTGHRADNEAGDALRQAIDDAIDIFTEQPARTVLRDAATTLSNAIADFKMAVPALTPDGWLDYTNFIANPSFETTLGAAWEVCKATGTSVAIQSISTALSSFVAGTDASKLLYITYKEGVDRAAVTQHISGLPRGYYRLTAKVTGDYDKHQLLFATTADSTYSTTSTTSAFGPMYFAESAVDSILVKDGELTVGIQTVDGWLRADDLHLYFTATDPTGISSIRQTPVLQGVWSLTGIRMGDERHLHHMPKGIYIVNGKKVICH